MGLNIFPETTATTTTGVGSPKLPDAVKYAADMQGSNARKLPLFTRGTSSTYFFVENATGAGSAALYVEDDVQQWQYTLTQINTALTLSADHWTGLHWYDTVDDLFYMLISDNSPSQYHLITITRGGTIALVGTDTDANLGFDLVEESSEQWWARASQGAGDFTIYSSDGSSHEVASISSTTGLVTSGSVAHVLVDGTDTIHSAGGNNQILYVTSDGKAAITGFGTASTSTGTGNDKYRIVNIGFSRKDSSGKALLSENHFGWAVTNYPETNNSRQAMRFERWDGKIVTSASIESGGNNVVLYGPRSFEITDFDTWVHDMCDWLGLDGEQ